MKKITHLLADICATLSARAADFTVDGIAYNITSCSFPYTVAVTSASSKYSGNLIIPVSATDEGGTYVVTSIADSAFYGCIGLASVERRLL